MSTKLIPFLVLFAWLCKSDAPRQHTQPQAVSDPLPFFQGYQDLPNPRPEDCVIVPLDNPKASDIVEQHTTSDDMKLMWRDIVDAHKHVRKGLYKSEQEIFQREADYLNKLLSKKVVPKS